MMQKPNATIKKNISRKKKQSKDGIVEGCSFGIRPDGTFFFTGV